MIFFVIATAWTWWGFRKRIRARDEAAAAEAARRAGGPGSGPGGSANGAGEGNGNGQGGRSDGRAGREALDARIEALCGDLSAVRAPRGTELNALSWQTEAPLRMLLNNLDPEVAEHPEELVVYGGSGRAARSHEALRDIVRTLLRLRDDETLLVQSGQARRGVPDARRRAARVDRELAARAEVGDLGRVPPARGRGADDVRADDGRVVDLHRHPGHSPGHLPDVLRRRGGALRLGRPVRADGAHRRPRRDGRRAAARGDDGRGGDSLRRGRPAVDRPSARDAVRRRAGLVPRRRGRAGAGRGGRGKAAVGGAARERGRRVPGARGARRALRSRHRSDGRARSADGVRAGARCRSRRRLLCAPATRSATSSSPPSRS